MAISDIVLFVNKILNNLKLRPCYGKGEMIKKIKFGILPFLSGSTQGTDKIPEFAHRLNTAPPQAVIIFDVR